MRLFMISSPMKRAAFLKKKHVFAQMGNDIMIMSRKIPLYPNLIRFHSNIWIASGVHFITHDVAHYMLNRKIRERKYTENIGCIEVMNNVFIGANTTILYNVRIGNNVIIGAGSIVTHDVEDNSVVAGAPAKKIGTFDDYMNKRYEKQKGKPVKQYGEKVSDDIAEWYWKDFSKARNSKA